MPDTEPEPLRRACVTSLVALAASPTPTDRSDAAAALVVFLDSEEAQAVLHDLALDPDPAVARSAAAAIAGRRDPAGWVVLTLALATADDTRCEVIASGIDDVVATSDVHRLVGARTALRLGEHPDEAIRAGAARLLAALGAPVEAD